MRCGERDRWEENTWGSSEKGGSILCIRAKEESKQCRDREMDKIMKD
jgi:hypothetical protein